VDEVIDTACNLENGIEPAEIEHPRDDPGGLSSKFAEAAAAAEASPQVAIVYPRTSCFTPFQTFGLKEGSSTPPRGRPAND
jgi:hypothetical protein